MVDDDVHIVTKDEASEIRARREFTAGLNEARRQFTKMVDAKDAEIARLRAERDALREALEFYVAGGLKNDPEWRLARAALAPLPPEGKGE